MTTYTAEAQARSAGTLTPADRRQLKQPVGGNAQQRRTHRRRARLLHQFNTAAGITVIWGVSLATALIWVSAGGIQTLTGFDWEAVNTLGRVAGLTSAVLLLFQVMLMSRLPIFENGFGRDTITRMHKTAGFWSFWLFMAHISLLVLGYARQAGVSLAAQVWDFVVNWPGMLLATLGTGMLLMVVVTSIKNARKKMRYESWHLIHLYGYLGTALAIPHMLWTGADFTGRPLVTAFWWALWIVTAAAVVLWRVLLPLYRSLRHAVRVTTVEPDGAGGVTVTMSGRDLDRLGAQAGQFFVWRFANRAGWTRGNPFSLSAAPTADSLTISAKIVGDSTASLTRLTPGTRVLFEGPYGTMTGVKRTGRKLLMLGAGAGVAPLVALLQDEEFTPGQAVLISRDTQPGDLMRAREISELITDRGLTFYQFDGHRARTSSPWLPERYRDWDGADMLRHTAGDLSDTDVFLCGPAAWMKAVSRDLERAGVSPAQIHSERFEH